MPNTPPAHEGAGLPSQMNLPILAIRNYVIFPVLAFPIKLGRHNAFQSVNQPL